MCNTNENDTALAFSRGFSAGNYANAYVSEDLERAWEDHVDPDDADDADDSEALGMLALPAHRAGFVLGFWGSYEVHEIPSENAEEAQAAWAAWRGHAAKARVAIPEWTDEEWAALYA